MAEMVYQQRDKESTRMGGSQQRSGGGRVLEDNRAVSKRIQLKENKTGLPDKLKSGVETLSGMSMDTVKVHYNSSQPAQLNALAYARGSDIHVAPGQEKHVPHEAWHVVQQAQGRVKPTMQLKDEVNVNDDQGLEREADLFGAKALQMRPADAVQGEVVSGTLLSNFLPSPVIVQRRLVNDDATLEADVTDTETRTGKAGLDLFEVLRTIAINYGNAIPPDATEADMINLLCVGVNPVLDQADCDFIRLKIEAITRSQAHADQENIERLNKLNQDAEQAKDVHINEITAAERDKLSSKHRRGLQQGFGEKYSAAKLVLDDAVAEAAQPGLADIENRLAADRLISTTVTMPQDYAAKKQQYDNFLIATGQHPLSFQALDFANNNITAAQNIMASVRLHPALSVLITDPASSFALWKNCIGTLTDVTTSAVLGRITFAELRAFNGTNQGLNLLTDLHAQMGVANIKISQVAVDLAHFGRYATNAGARAALAGLMVANPVATLKGLFQAMTMVPNLEKPIELAALFPYAASPAALLGGIQFASQVGLLQAQLRSIIIALPPGSTLLAITNRIKARTLLEIDKHTQFSQWIHAIDALMVSSGFTIAVGGSAPLGAYTMERHCIVSDALGNIRGRFEIHYHPGAGNAQVGSPYASPKHIKPISGNATTSRLYWESIPNNVKGELPNKW